MKLGIDVSFHKGNPNWSQAKGSIDFAILAVTELYNGIDPTFESNYQGCHANGIPVGVYSYSYAKNGDDSERYARLIVNQLQGKQIDLPVFLDLEWEGQENFPQSRINDIIIKFRDVIEAAGYRFGIYCNKDWYYMRIPDFAKSCPLWLGWPATNGNSFPADKVPDLKNLMLWQYSWTGQVPGFGNQEIDMDAWLDESDQEQDASGQTQVTAKDALDVIRGWIGRNESDGSHRAIVDIYNGHSPLAQGYRLSYSDSWCDATVSAVFISLGATDLIGGTECGVERHVQLFKAAGIWTEDGSIRPTAGDIIVFNWGEDQQPNDGFADHIGLVESVDGDVVHTIEGNAGGAVCRRTYHVGDGCIRGYARPKYLAQKVDPEKVPEGHETNSQSEDHYPMLSEGSVGDDVLELQKALNRCGYDLEEDGIFGPLTQTAVLWYQRDHRLEVDGIVGPETWASLQGRKKSGSDSDLSIWADNYIRAKWPDIKAIRLSKKIIVDVLTAYLSEHR